MNLPMRDYLNSAIALFCACTAVYLQSREDHHTTRAWTSMLAPSNEAQIRPKGRDPLRSLPIHKSWTVPEPQDGVSS
eukprot:6866766-Alexandrium_andersonii.AAC.1